MQRDRVEYLLLLDGMEDAALWSACRVALRLVARDMAMAETDIPWSMRTTWPSEVVDAATRLCDRFVPERKRDDYYLQTGVRSVADPSVRDDFTAMIAATAKSPAARGQHGRMDRAHPSIWRRWMDRLKSPHG